MSVLVYTLLAVGPAVEHCHTDETVPGHEDHCQGCHATQISAAPANCRKVVNTEFVLTDQSSSKAPPFLSLTPDAILHNRAPPVDPG